VEALVVGIKKLDFKTDGGEQVKRTIWYLNLEEENVEGYAIDQTSWNEITDGKPPAIAVGELVEVNYNKRGKLMMAKKK